MNVTPNAERCLGPLSQVPLGEGRVLAVPNGPSVAVFHLRSGAVHATQAGCPHRDGPLADGILGGTTLICPLHGRKFDVATGAALGDVGDLVTYPARVSAAGDILVTVQPCG